MNLLQMSVSAGVLIAVLVTVRALFHKHLRKQAIMILWGLALIRLLIPFSIPSPFSVYTLLPTNTTGMEAMYQAPLTTLLPATTHEAVITKDYIAGTPSTMPFSSWEILWFTGALVCVLTFTICYLSCLGNFKTSLPVSNDYTQKWLAEHSCKRPITFRQSDLIASPLTYGIFRPVILLPKAMDWKDPEQLHYIFLHEYVHIRRFDLIRKLLMTTALCIHWFNPLVWMMYFLFNRDIELACDEAVLQQETGDSRADYARALVNMAVPQSGSVHLFSHFSKSTIEERIIAIMKPKKITIAGSIATLALILCIGIGFLTSAQAAQAEETDLPQNVENNAIEKISTDTDAIVTLPSDISTDMTYLSADSVVSDTATEVCWTWPTISTKLSMTFGERIHPATGEIKLVDHICIAGTKGDSVYAAREGSVTEVAFRAEQGNYVVIAFEDGYCIYGHLMDTLVAVGDTVESGDSIGTLGATGMATGPCLSFGVVQNGEAVDPMQFFE